jgi:hypothetical protein
MVDEKRNRRTGKITVEGGDDVDDIRVHNYDSDGDGKTDGITVEAGRLLKVGKELI